MRRRRSTGSAPSLPGSAASAHRGQSGAADAESAVLPGISEGWPRIMADLKTLLETGALQPAG